MKRSAEQPAVITFSARIYTALLILYPAAYRQVFGAQMVQVFQDVAHDSYDQRGIAGIVFWWCAAFFDLIFTAIEQRKEGKAMMSQSLPIRPVKGTGIGLMCILGGIIYFLGGVWLSLEGIPTALTSVQLTHLLRMIWAGGTACGLLGMMVTQATDDGLLARTAAWVCGIGLSIIVSDGLIAMINRYPVAAFTDSSLPFSHWGQIVPLVSWIVLTFLITRHTQWDGWSKIAPLVTLLAPFVGLLFGSLLGIRFLPIMIMGGGLALLGFALKTQLDKKRRMVNQLSPIA